MSNRLGEEGLQFPLPSSLFEQLTASTRFPSPVVPLANSFASTLCSFQNAINAVKL